MWRKTFWGPQQQQQQQQQTLFMVISVVVVSLDDMLDFNHYNRIEWFLAAALKTRRHSNEARSGTFLDEDFL